MKQKTKNKILYSIGILFSVVFIISVITFLIDKDPQGLLWVCYIALLLIPVAIFTKNSSLLLSQIIIIAVPDILWTIDFMLLLFTGNSPLGSASYMFKGRYPLLDIISLFHIYTLPLSLWALSIIKTKENRKRTLLIAAIELMTIFLIGISFDLGRNINCLPSGAHCTNFPFPVIPYYVWWWIIMMLFSGASYLVIEIVKKLKKV